MTKIKDIRVFYKFRPSVSIWTTKTEGSTHSYFMWDETWDGGHWFKYAIFAFIQFRAFALHIKVKWWKMKGEI